MAFQFTSLAVTPMAAAALVLGTGAPVAHAAPAPCAASTIAKTVGSVGTNTGIYLEANPETNDVLTTLAAQPAGPQSVAALKLYFERDPQAAKDLQAIQQPLTSLTAKCKLPISLPQVLGLMQAAQQGGSPAGLPDAATAIAGAESALGASPAKPALPVGVATGTLAGLP
ncbi:MAG: hemophore [Mycobacterium sp.]